MLFGCDYYSGIDKAASMPTMPSAVNSYMYLLSGVPPVRFPLLYRWLNRSLTTSSSHKAASRHPTRVPIPNDTKKSSSPMIH